MTLLLSLPAITHNPWHPAYELTPEGRHWVAKQISNAILNEIRALRPDDSIEIKVGGVPYCGYFRS